MDDPPLVYVVILNYDGKSHLEYCLPSIMSTEYSNYEVVLVDNDSSDDSVEYVRENFPSVTVLEQDRNRGWGGGNNVGVEHASEQGADYIVLANNDIRVHPKWLTAAVRAAERDPDVGFVGFDIYGTIRPVPLEEYEEACESWTEISFDYTDDFIDGMAVFVRMEVFDEVGPIDEDFFLYAGETDLEIRASRAGYRRMRTNVPVWHYSSGTTAKMPVKSAYWANRNHIRLALKHGSPTGVAYTVLKLYYTGCHPLFDGDMENRITARRRPRGIVFNFFLITYCLLWNVVHLPWTWRAKKTDYGRIREARGERSN